MRIERVIGRYKEWREYKRKNRMYFMLKDFTLPCKRCYTFREFMTHSDSELEQIELYASPVMKRILESSSSSKTKVSA